MSVKRKREDQEVANRNDDGKDGPKDGFGKTCISFAATCCAMCCCDEEQMYHGFLLFCSLFVIISQATILNVYIIAFFRGFRHQAFTYFVFLGDLFVVCVFAVSFLSAYRYNHLRRKLKLDYQESRMQQRVVRKKIEDRIYHSIPWLSRRFGTLPYLPFAWLVYSVFLVFKVGLIFTTYVTFFQSTDDNYQVELYQNQSLGCSSSSNGTGSNGEYKPFSENESVLELGPNLLKLAVGSTALVFIIILQAHHNHQDNTAHGGHMLGVCHNISVEVFDSVTLLSLLISKHEDFNEIWTSFNKPIVVLSSLNLVFPAITLFSLTLSDFGRKMSKITRLTVTNQALQLFLINIPFLYVRLYLWAQYRMDLSMFVVKNLCYIFLLSHSLYPGMIRMFKECDKRRKKIGDITRKRLHSVDQPFSSKYEDDSHTQPIEETFDDPPIARLDQVDYGRPTALNQKSGSSMDVCIPMSELSHTVAKDIDDKNIGSIKRRQDSSNVATNALVESITKSPTNPNHRVSTSSSSPTTVGSPSSTKPSSPV